MKKAALPAVSPTTRVRPSGVVAMWCGSRNTGRRRISAWLSMSNSSIEASAEFSTKAIRAARAPCGGSATSSRAAAPRRLRRTVELLTCGINAFA